MRWPGPILTDCGGFQVMSLPSCASSTSAGVTFQSHIDGAVHHLTPERSIEIQSLLGCRHPDAARRMRRAACRGRRRSSGPWSCRCAGPSARRRAFGAAQPGKALFGIVQGGDRPELCAALGRARSSAMDLDGYAVGGLAVGEPQAEMLEIAGGDPSALPADGRAI